MATGRFRAALVLALISVSLGFGGCDSAPSGEDPEATVAYSSQPDSLDPALTYSIEGAAILWNVYSPPLTYRHEDGRAGVELIPALAERLPEVSADGLRYSFRLRQGLRYSDGRRVRASDFERAVKRTLFLASPGSRYFLGVRGAKAYLGREDPQGDIAGIRTDDARRLVIIYLKLPDGTFRYGLASTFAAPVPPGTPFERLTKTLPPATGAFRFESVDPGREIVLVRNSKAPRLPGVPRSKLRRLSIRIMKSRQRQALDISRNRLDYMLDPIPVDLLPMMKREHPDRYEEFVSNSTYYFWLNSAARPFDNPRLRHAVHMAVNKPALSRLYGGMLQPTCNFLPPAMPGYARLEPCPFGDPHKSGDVAAARKIVEAEGAIGTTVKVWGNSSTQTRAITELFANQLASIGFDPKIEILHLSVYFQSIGDPADAGFQAGFGNWFQEFAHPANFLAAVRGDLITPEGNYNYSRTNIPSLTQAIKRLQRRSGLDEATLAKWAELDRRVVEDGGVIPFGHLTYSTFMSERMDFKNCSPNHAVYITDFSRFCVR